MSYQYEYDIEIDGQKYLIQCNASVEVTEEKQTHDYPGSLSIEAQIEETLVTKEPEGEPVTDKKIVEQAQELVQIYVERDYDGPEQTWQDEEDHLYQRHKEEGS